MGYITQQFWVLLAAVFVLYAAAPNRFKWIVLLAGSLYFYGSSGLDKLGVFVATSLVVWLCSLRMEKIWALCEARCQNEPAAVKRSLRKEYTKHSRVWLFTGLAVTLGILVCCKVWMHLGAAGRSPALRFIVPLGVSYYTFASVGYLLDIHRRKVKTAEHNYFRLLTCMAYFPHIVQGPIPRYERLLPQFAALRLPDYKTFCFGLQRVVWGLFEKLVIADRLGIFVGRVFADIEGAGGVTCAIALVFATIWTYADFCGCMDIVIGISECLGVRLDENFCQPFFSCSAAEFWRRWHITLGAWFKDYVFLPISTSSFLRSARRKAEASFGERGGKAAMTIVPLGTVWFLVGIWHGTGIDYVLWGMYWGVLITCSILFEERMKAWPKRLGIDTESRKWKRIQRIRTFFVCVTANLLVLPGSLDKSLALLSGIVTRLDLWVLWDNSLYTHGLNRANFIFAVLSIVFLFYVDTLREKGQVREAIARKNIVLRWSIYYLAIFAVLIFGVYGPGYNAASFLYADF